MENIKYEPVGVCSREIDIKINDGIVEDIVFYGGCNGNLKGLSSMCRGQKPEYIIERLKGIKCGMKNTSCPDQLAQCLIEYLSKQKEKVSIN